MSNASWGQGDYFSIISQLSPQPHLASSPSTPGLGGLVTFSRFLPCPGGVSRGGCGGACWQRRDPIWTCFERYGSRPEDRLLLYIAYRQLLLWHVLGRSRRSHSARHDHLVARCGCLDGVPGEKMSLLPSPQAQPDLVGPVSRGDNCALIEN